MTKKTTETTTATTETITTETGQIAVHRDNPIAVIGGSESWGAADQIDATDILVGKIFHQQALSKFVQDGIAMAGDWCDSLTGNVLAKKDEPLELIVFSSFKKLLISCDANRTGKYEFVEAQDVTPANINLPWQEDTPEGIIKRQLQYSYFALMTTKLDELPYVLSFSSTKIKTAKKLNTFIAKLARMKRPSASCCFEFRSVKETGDKGTWFAVDIRQGRMTTPIELEVALDWYKQVKRSQVRVAEEREEVQPSSLDHSQNGPGPYNDGTDDDYVAPYSTGGVGRNI